MLLNKEFGKQNYSQLYQVKDPTGAIVEELLIYHCTGQHTFMDLFYETQKRMSRVEHCRSGRRGISIANS